MSTASPSFLLLFFLCMVMVGRVFTFPFDSHFPITSETSESLTLGGIDTRMSMQLNFANMSGMARLNNLELVSNTFPRLVSSSFLPYPDMSVYNVFEIDLSKSYLASDSLIPSLQISMNIDATNVVDTDPNSYRCVVFKNSQTIVPVKTLSQQDNFISFTVLYLVRDYIGKNNTLMFGLVGKTFVDYRAQFDNLYLLEFKRSLNYRPLFAPTSENLKVTYSSSRSNWFSLLDKQEFPPIMVGDDDCVPIYSLQTNLTSTSQVYFDWRLYFKNYTFLNSSNGNPINIKPDSLKIFFRHGYTWFDAEAKLLCNEIGCQLSTYASAKDSQLVICGIQVTNPPEPYIRHDSRLGVALRNNSKLFLEPISYGIPHYYSILVPASHQVKFSIARIFSSESPTFSIYQSFNVQKPNSTFYDSQAEITKFVKSATFYNSGTLNQTCYFQIFAKENLVSYIDIVASTLPLYNSAQTSEIIPETSEALILSSWKRITIGVVVGSVSLIAIIIFSIVFIVILKIRRSKANKNKLTSLPIPEGASSHYYEMRD